MGVVCHSEAAAFWRTKNLCSWFGAETSPVGADYHSPGRRPGSKNPPPLKWEALKGRNSKVGTHADYRLTLRGDPYYALSGLENPNGVNFRTQAVGLGCGSPPLRG